MTEDSDGFKIAPATVDELRVLSREPNTTSDIRARFGKALVDAHWSARVSGEVSRAEELLAELRSFAAREAGSEEFLASGLAGAHHYARGQGKTARANTLLEELSLLVSRNPESKRIKGVFAAALTTAYLFAESKDAFGDALKLLEQHQGLGQSEESFWDDLGLIFSLNFPIRIDGSRELSQAERKLCRLALDERVPEDLKKWCSDRLICAAYSLDELRVLASAEGASPKVLHAFCSVLGGAAGDCPDPTESERLLDELRAWARRAGTHESRHLLARALLSAHFKRDQTTVKAALLLEAGTIALTDPDDDNSFTRWLARWMHRVGWEARGEGREALADQLLEQLRALANREGCADDVAEQLIAALCVAYLFALDDGYLTAAKRLLNELRVQVLRRSTRPILGELRSIAAMGPADGELWEIAARGLHQAYRNALEAGDADAAESWFKQLQKLARRKGASDALRAWLVDALQEAGIPS